MRSTFQPGPAAADVPERQRQRQGRMQVKINARVIAVHKRPEDIRVLGHRIAQDGSVGHLVQEAEGADRAGDENREPGERDIASPPT